MYCDTYIVPRYHKSFAQFRIIHRIFFDCLKDSFPFPGNPFPLSHPEIAVGEPKEAPQSPGRREVPDVPSKGDKERNKDWLVDLTNFFHI